MRRELNFTQIIIILLLISGLVGWFIYFFIKNKKEILKKMKEFKKVKIKKILKYISIQNMNNKAKKITLIVTIIIVVTCLIISISNWVIVKRILPKKYISLINENYDSTQYEKVAEYASKLGTIKEYLKDNDDKYKNIEYKVKDSSATILFNNENYEMALQELEKIELEDNNIQRKINECKYELAKQYIDKERYTPALKLLNDVVDKNDINELKDKAHFNLALIYLKSREYSKSLEEIKKVSNEQYENLEITKKQINYEYGKYYFNIDKYESAISYLEQAKDYEDANTFLNNAYIEKAEKYIKQGNIQEARNIYNFLPNDIEYNGIKVNVRKNQINKFSGLIGATGIKYATKCYCESRNVWRYDGRWSNWHIDVPDNSEYINTSLTLNNDGTVTLKGTVYFYAFNNFSTLADYCKANIISKTIKLENLNSIASSYDLDDNTKLLYSNGVFSIKYSKRDDYSTSFYNLYMSSVTY